LKRLKVR